MMVAILAGVQLETGPHSSAQHAVTPCFLAPGIYSLYAYDVHQVSDHSSGTWAGLGTVTNVSPAYFIVE